MLKFDSDSIYYRAMALLQQDPSWKVISNDTVVSSLVRSNAEIMAELARYTEYQFNESKWDTAQNTSSILAHAGLLGYRPKRKISARGRIYISANPNIHLVGTSISTSSFKNLKNSSSSSWSSNVNLKIYSSSTITDSKGNSYVASPTTLERGVPYSTLSIIEGQRKTQFVDINTIRATYTTSKLDPYLYIPVVIQNCEAADNIDSKKFFRVYLAKGSSLDNLKYTEYRIVDSLLLSDSGDQDVEVYNDLYNRNLFYFKFNNDPLRGGVLDITSNSSLLGLRIDYVESSGASGDVVDSFETFTIKGVYNPEDTSNTEYTLYGINLEPITGGADEESVADIKVKAPKYYITNFSTGTKETYAKTIENLVMQVPYYKDSNSGTPSYKKITPKKVKVFGSTEKLEGGLERKVTGVTFLDDDLEDFSSTTSEAESLYSNIADTLELYLEALKSPQDVIKFYAPEYIPFAINVTCTLDKEGDSIQDNVSNVRAYINELWGSQSSSLDFDRSFYPAELIYSLKSNFEDIVDVSIETEAIQKLNWDEAKRKNPNGDEVSSSATIHTCRIPFDFSGLFLGRKNTLGFKDHRVGAEYVMRIDFMYKLPNNSGISTSNLHTSIFIKEDEGRRDNDAFYLVNDTSSNSSIWKISELSGDTGNSSLEDYTMLSSSETSQLTKSYQFRYKKEIYGDDDFRKLVSSGAYSSTDTLKSHLIDLGTVDDYLVYFDSNYEEGSDTCGEGWIEFTFDSLYSVLSTFATYDSTLSARLQNCPLALLKCGTSKSGGSDVFTTFRTIAEEYIDIYVSLRPNDESIKIDSADENYSNSVLYIDSYDAGSPVNEDKLPRMISLKFKYEG